MHFIKNLRSKNFGHYRQEITAYLRKIHNEELPDLFPHNTLFRRSSKGG
jgi:hypothetical protein